MNLFDILFMRKTGKIKPDADLFDVLFAKKLSGGEGVITTLTGNPLSFLAKKAQKALSTKVTLSPIQAGSGNPSPTNIRPISGRSSVTIKCANGESAVHDTVTISFGETVYGGTLDVEQGQVVVDKGIVDMGTLSWSYSSAADCFYNRSIENLRYNSTPLCTCLWPRSPITANSQAQSMSNNRITFKMNVDDQRIYAKYADAEKSSNAFKTAMSGQYLCYELVTPRTITLTPEQIQILKGENNIWIEDDGATIELSYMN